MYRVFNMGIGFVLVVSQHFATSLLAAIRAHGHEAWLIGKVIEGNREVHLR
jgi:phosphoribosylformylglycinamidine cyclo-ligase